MENGEITPDELGSASKACEVVLSSCKAQLAYNTLRQEVPQIEFLNSSTTKLIK